MDNRKGLKSQNLRSKILAFVSALIVLSVLGSTLSLYRVTEVNRLLDSINRVSVPMGRLFTQMQSDATVFKRELDRGLGDSHWHDPHWRARPIPKWIEDLLVSETQRLGELVRTDVEWAPSTNAGDSRDHWVEWSRHLTDDLNGLRAGAAELYGLLDRGDLKQAAELYPRWNARQEEWLRQLQWGAQEYERQLRQSFALAESRASQLRMGLEMVLVVVVCLSLLLLWFGERALRPLAELTSLAREIARRGLRKEDKEILPEIFMSRSDEVSHLAREFHRMATALLEREKIVDQQKARLQDQNLLLREMGELNESVLKSIDSILIVTDLENRITQCNPVASRWLGKPIAEILGTGIGTWRQLGEVLKPGQSERIEPVKIDSRVYGGRLIPLRRANLGQGGSILVLDDLTDELDLQDRLRMAENLAAVGRMSAQVAHEVRNPLHALGLEAELALDTATKIGSLPLKNSLQSILAAVDRLEKITENYLKLSRLSAGEKSEFDLGDAWDGTLATYAAACENQGVRVDWERESGASLRVWGDRDLIEQALGNLLKNSLQALESSGVAQPRIAVKMGSTESARVWLRIEDNGPGIAPEVLEKLFTPFVTTRAQGTGLGLSFVKKVIEEHLGTVQIAAENKTGAAFIVILPGLAPEAQVVLEQEATW